MLDFVYRTEDIKNEDIESYFVETQKDRDIIAGLKSQTPTILVGSRGVGKSFLLKIAYAELLASFKSDRILPVYITFNRGSLIQTDDPLQFQHWMLAKICQAILRALKQQGLLIKASKNNMSILGSDGSDNVESSIVDKFENSWKTPGGNVDVSSLPNIDDFKFAVEDICGELSISRFCFMFDEAVHVFLPEQQRQFFTLFRDLRSPYVSCNAAVYPGITSFGDTFQPSHDASMLFVERDVLDKDYTKNMREIIEKQVLHSNETGILRDISRNMDNFRILAFSANGNPRVLLKTVAKASKMNSTQVNSTIKEYFRTDIWAEHSNLAETYEGHSILFEWGRKFIEDTVLPELKAKNDQNLGKKDAKSSCYIWIHKDSPEAVKLALRLLDYTGILSEHSKGIRATRAEIGTRYMINLGCLLASEANPNIDGLPVINNLTIKRMTEYGANHPAYDTIIKSKTAFSPPSPAKIVQQKLTQSVEILDISPWLCEQLHSINIHTVKDILESTEETIKQLYYVGDVRSRHVRNVAMAAVYEYLSG